MSQHKINWKDFRPENLVFGDVEKKEAKSDASAKYTAFSIKYKYTVTTKDGKTLTVIDDFNMELPPCISKNGIQSKINEKSGKRETTIKANFDITDPEIPKFADSGSFDDLESMGVMGQLKYACTQYMFQNKTKFETAVSNAKKLESLEGYLDPFLYLPAEAEGKNPSKFFKLMEIGEPGSAGRREAIFNYPGKDEKGNYKKINWDILQNSYMKVIFCLHIRQVYIGSKKQIQANVKSGVVIDLKACADEDTQGETIESEIEKDGSLQAKIEETMKAIAESRALFATKSKEAGLLKAVDNSADPKPETAVAIEDFKSILSSGDDPAGSDEDLPGM